MEQLGRTIPAFGGLFLGGFFSEVEKKIVVDLGDADGPVEKAFHSFRRLKDGDGLGLAGGDVNGRDFFRLEIQLLGIFTFQFPSGDFPGGFNGNQLVDHGRIGDLNQPDDDRTGIGDQGERAGPPADAFGDRPVDQFNIDGVFPDGVEPEA